MADTQLGTAGIVTSARTSTRLRRVLAAFLGLHGLAHLAGTSDVFSKAADRGAADYLAGLWTVSDPALLRAFGVLWALLAVAFVLVAVITWTGRPGWPRVLGAVTAGSLALVVLALWSSVVGVVVNAGLLVVAWRSGRDT